MNSKFARNSLIAAAVIMAVTASFFTVIHVINKGGKSGAAGKNVKYEKAKSNKGVVEIKEKMFISQVNDVYLNAEDYLGKTIKLEGIFKQEEGYCFVIRYGPGCCGNDGNAGFEVAWAKGKAKQYPDADSWVEAKGVLKTYGEEGFIQILYLDLISLTTLSRRGAETVLQ